jgi:hypothetical protein
MLDEVAWGFFRDWLLRLKSSQYSIEFDPMAGKNLRSHSEA